MESKTERKHPTSGGMGSLHRIMKASRGVTPRSGVGQEWKQGEAECGHLYVSLFCWWSCPKGVEQVFYRSVIGRRGLDDQVAVEFPYSMITTVYLPLLALSDSILDQVLNGANNVISCDAPLRLVRSTAGTTLQRFIEIECRSFRKTRFIHYDVSNVVDTSDKDCVINIRRGCASSQDENK